ncbi:hypothetical protein GTP38_16180 [Duganella sp. FT94W]|uniref:Uncharacterized protein n=1 Tax=Duganella lactea TaxID=2692173 RepID=A0ABW9VB14_9BURK|nr:hypothetical protein [Duganella lactea]MYM35874.1 hypothetical protein [Duganella lactea]
MSSIQLVIEICKITILYDKTMTTATFISAHAALNRVAPASAADQNTANDFVSQSAESLTTPPNEHDNCSVAALTNYYPKLGGVAFIYASDYNKLVMGKPQRHAGLSGSTHEQLAYVMGVPG